MKLKKISKKELKDIIKKNKSFSRYWKNKEISGLYAINNDKDLVGLLSIGNRRDCLFVNMIEISEKKKGFGKKTVDILKNMTTKNIKGIPASDAEEFWKKMGAKFDETIYFTIEKEKY